MSLWFLYDNALAAMASFFMHREKILAWPPGRIRAEMVKMPKKMEVDPIWRLRSMPPMAVDVRIYRADHCLINIEQEI